MIKPDITWIVIAMIFAITIFLIVVIYQIKNYSAKKRNDKDKIIAIQKALKDPYISKYFNYLILIIIFVFYFNFFNIKNPKIEEFIFKLILVWCDILGVRTLIRLLLVK